MNITIEHQIFDTIINIEGLKRDTFSLNCFVERPVWAISENRLAAINMQSKWFAIQGVA